MGSISLCSSKGNWVFRTFRKQIGSLFDEDPWSRRCLILENSHGIEKTNDVGLTTGEESNERVQDILEHFSNSEMCHLDEQTFECCSALLSAEKVIASLMPRSFERYQWTVAKFRVGHYHTCDYLVISAPSVLFDMLALLPGLNSLKITLHVYAASVFSPSDKWRTEIDILRTIPILG